MDSVAGLVFTISKNIFKVVKGNRKMQRYCPTIQFWQVFYT